MNLPINVDLTGKTAVITGGGGVLCSIFAEVLALSGAKVAILDISKDAADTVSENINKKGGVSKGYCCNVLEKESIELAHSEILKDFGPCDILINGAGGNHPSATTDNEYFSKDTEDGIKTFFDLEKSGVESVFNLNFLGTLLTTQVFAKDMVESEDASIINISSMNAYTPLTKIPAYSGAKAAVSNFTQWLAVHFSKTNIRCNAIAPGFFVTKQNERLLFNENGTPTPRTHKILNNTPMGRFGTPDELTGALLFLVSKKASGFINGVVIPVDGGFSAYSGV